MKVVFACAGTGGHVNPAIAIARIILSKKKELTRKRIVMSVCQAQK